MGQEMGQQRPVHNSGHPDWNKEVRKEMEKLKAKLKGMRLNQPSGDYYDQQVRQLLEELQQNLRQRMLDFSHMPRLTQNESETMAT